MKGVGVGGFLLLGVWFGGLGWVWFGTVGCLGACIFVGCSLGVEMRGEERGGGGGEGEVVIYL